MRSLKVQHQTLPGIGDLFEISLDSDHTIRVAAQRSGRRELSRDGTDPGQSPVTVSLTRTEAAGLAALLLGAHVEVIEHKA